jgi:tRNA A-37 threonylcarbamoyl transferase component Bud32
MEHQRSHQLDRAQLDPLSSPVLQRELPGLAAALDEQIMRERLQTTFFGADSRFVIERCNPGQAIYLAGDFCGLRYEMEVRDTASGEMIEPLVIGRVFQDQSACARFFHDQLEPVAALARNREELAPFVTPIALFESLNMAAHVFPIDGELPALLDVTDQRRVIEILRETLPEVQEGRFMPHACRVELAHYGRQHRCTLRYVLEGTASDGANAHQVVYGKVTADGSGERTIPVLAALRERLPALNGMDRVNIPRVLGFHPDLQLLLLEAIPGKPQVARLLKARLAGAEATQPGMLTLEHAVGDCGRIAARMHTSGIALGQPRTIDAELDWLRQSIHALRRISPEPGAQLQDWLEWISACAARTDPLPLCFSHGDFTYTQLIFDDRQCGLVDFDTICQAEPALDLGQFLAYQRLAIRKDQRPDAPFPEAATEQLCEQFLNAYEAASGERWGDKQRLRERVAVYEILMLLRLAVHSWQKLKISRLEHAMKLLEERIACLQ